MGRADNSMQLRMPWQLSWQLNERTLKLTDDMQAHLVRVLAILSRHSSSFLSYRGVCWRLEVVVALAAEFQTMP